MYTAKHNFLKTGFLMILLGITITSFDNADKAKSVAQCLKAPTRASALSPT